MDEVLQSYMDQLLNIISDDERISELKKLKKNLLNDDELLRKINIVQNSSSITKFQKEELYKNDNYRQYQHLENEIYFLTLEMNKILNRLVDKKVCHK